jgi:hypothetical protein
LDGKNGADYPQNYDVIVKWLAGALRGQTLDVIGVQTGRIEEVFWFEPADISVRAGRVDVMVRDEKGDIYHIEEQRNLQKSDLYRFAAYHFLAARKYGLRLTDIVLASGNVYAGEKTVVTSSGRYQPTVVDFSRLDGRKRLEEIRQAVRDGAFDNWLELVFLPLYGKETGAARSEIVEQVIRFETSLFHAQKLSAKILAATLIMSNKLIDKKRIEELWEEIKMLDVLDVAREKGIEEGKTIGIKEGKTLGIEEGKLEATRKLLLNLLLEKFNGISMRVSDRIKQIQDPDILEFLFRQAFRCEDMEAFEAVLSRLE